MKDFSNAKVGDTVWDFIYGYGEVVIICDEMYIGVKFKNILIIMTYSIYGILEGCRTQTLFWNEFKAPKEAFIKQPPKLEIDTKVLVWDSNSVLKHKRYFSHFDENGKCCTFVNGSTSWSSIYKKIDTEVWAWDNYELVE